LLLNLALIAGIFLVAAWFGQNPPAWRTRLTLSDDWFKSSLWLLAMICSLPFFIANSRKLAAVGLAVAEIRVTESLAGPRTAAIRSIVAQLIPLAGTVAQGMCVLALSSTLLTTFKVFLVLLAIVALLSWLLRRYFVRVYSHAQVALAETFHQSPHHPASASGHSDDPTFETHPTGTSTPLPNLLRDANLRTVALPPGAAAHGRRIRELQLRTATGASIVGIERAGTNLLNPDPDEELRTGDHILLLGHPTQLDAAERTLVQPPAPA
jgi:CPA2 family monovalent cation:H+ antiporter-2